MAGEAPKIVAAAASSTIARYRPNGAESSPPRDLPSLLAWAANCGVTVPDWCEVRVAQEGFEPEINGRPVPAAYFRFSSFAPERLIYWQDRSVRAASVVDPASGKVVISVRRSVLNSDEQFLHVLAHETFEIGRLREEFEAMSGRQMSFAALGELTRAERGLNNLHSEAWEHADAVLRTFRAADESSAGSEP